MVPIFGLARHGYCAAMAMVRRIVAAKADPRAETAFLREVANDRSSRKE